MRKSKLVFNPGATMKELQKSATVKSEVSAAVTKLNYDPEKQNLTIEDCVLCRYVVRFGKRYDGVWGSRRHNFMD